MYRCSRHQIEKLEVTSFECDETFHFKYSDIGNEKESPSCNVLETGVLRLPTFACNQAGDWLMLSDGGQPQHTHVYTEKKTLLAQQNVLLI